MDEELEREIGWLLGVKDPAQWLTDIYGKRRAQEDIAIQFSDQAITHYLPRKELLGSFEYFQKAFAADNGVPRWKEGVSYGCKPDVTSKDFGWVWRWIQIHATVQLVDNNRDLYYIDEVDIWNDCDLVKDVLEAIVSADHLLLVSKFNIPFIHNMARLVGLMLKRDRRNLTSADVEFVQSHRVFTTGDDYDFPVEFARLQWYLCGESSCQIFTYLFAISAVKPFLQAGMASVQYERIQRNHDGKGSALLPDSGHVNFDDWCAIIKHCKHLMSGNLPFAMKVMEAVSQTLTMQLQTLDDKNSSERQRYRDPLDLFLGNMLEDNTTANHKVDHRFVI